MKVQDIIRKPEEAFIHLERYVNNGSPSGFSSNTTSDLTKPQGNTKTFNVAIIQFDESIEMVDVGENKYYNLPSRAVFCHPDNMTLPILQDIKEHWSQIGTIEVVPTASGRTVKCVGQHKFFIKLDYFEMLGRMKRNLDSKRLISAWEVNDIIFKVIKEKKFTQQFSFFRENYGRCAKLPLPSGKVYELGFIIREDKPCPFNPDVIAYIPFFSLFAKDSASPADELILIQLFKLQKKSANEFFFEIIRAVLESYFDMLTNCGLCLEAHSQNILLGIDKNFQMVCIVARDMESIDKDVPVRKFLGLSTAFKSEPYKCLHETDYNYTIMHSFMFDFKLGCYLIDPLINVFENFETFNTDLAIEQIKKLVNKRIELLPKDYFPSQWYSYKNEIFERGLKRPYIIHNNPRYR